MEALVFCVDVGRGMKDHDNDDSHMELCRRFVTMALQRKIFSESKDEVALILFGCEETSNRLADIYGAHKYQNIAIVRELESVDWNLVRLAEQELVATDYDADWMNVLVVALDHLIEGNDGKKFKGNSIVLLSAFSQEFSDEYFTQIQDTLAKHEIALTVIGPEFLRSYDDNSGSGEEENNQIPDESEAGPSNGRQAKRQRVRPPSSETCFTHQQRKAERFLKQMLSQLVGEHMPFSEALSYVAHMKTRAVRPTPWKVNLTIGSDFQIAVCGYKKVATNAPKQTWKLQYAIDKQKEVVQETKYHLEQEPTKEISKDDVVIAYRYGGTLVTMSKENIEEYAKYKVPRQLAMLGCTAERNVRREYYSGDGVWYIFADSQDPNASVALSALIGALYEVAMVAIARYSYSAACAPKLVALIPKTNQGRELPYADDIRKLRFAPIESMKKFEPSSEQLNAVDDLITSLDLSNAEIDLMGNPDEAVKPKKVINPQIQRLFQCLQHRVLHPTEPVPDVPEALVRQMQTPDERVNLALPVWDKMRTLFRLEFVQAENGETSAEKNRRDEDEFKKLWASVEN